MLMVRTKEVQTAFEMFRNIYIYIKYIFYSQYLEWSKLSLFCCHIPVYILKVLLFCHLSWVFCCSDIYIFIWVGFCCCALFQCVLLVFVGIFSFGSKPLAHSFYCGCSRLLGSRSSGFGGEKKTKNWPVIWLMATSWAEALHKSVKTVVRNIHLL